MIGLLTDKKKINKSVYFDIVIKQNKVCLFKTDSFIFLNGTQKKNPNDYV